jgi:hypothetical protein
MIIPWVMRFHLKNDPTEGIPPKQFLPLNNFNPRKSFVESLIEIGLRP